MEQPFPTWSGDEAPRVGVHVAWAGAPSNLDEARTRTHDNLIEQMGANRAGPVSWRIVAGKEALTVMDELDAAQATDDIAPILGDDVAETMRDQHRQVRKLLAQYGGFLVVAFAAAHA